MPEPKWTPGPWLHEGCGVWALTDSRNWYKDGKLQQVNRFSAGVQGANPESADEAEKEANACLMASAPDLYDALAGLIAMQDKMGTPPRDGGGVFPADYGIARGKAHAALAKARGEENTR